MKKVLVLLLVAIMAVSVFAACAAPAPAPASEAPASEAPASEAPASEAPASEAPASEAPASEAPASEAPTGTTKFNYTPVENPENKEVKIATLCVQNNPFWVTVVEGINAAKEELASKNVTVDLISFEDFDGQAFAEAIDTCVVKGYDAITTVGVADSIVPAINKAVDAGIPVYVFNSDTDKESKRTAFIGQDLQAAGVVAGETLAKLIGNEGKVGIITGFYNVYAHELRRKGIEEALGKESKIEIVGTVENHDSGDEAYTATKDFITANPDIKGIVVTAGGPHGAAKAIEELGLQDQISLVSFDTTDEIVAYIKKGIIKASIGQDPFGQGADPIILAYNEIISGTPQVTGDAFTAMDAYTPENIKDSFPD